jgi:hypothetical protein
MSGVIIASGMRKTVANPAGIKINTVNNSVSRRPRIFKGIVSTKIPACRKNANTLRKITAHMISSKTEIISIGNLPYLYYNTNLYKERFNFPVGSFPL